MHFYETGLCCRLLFEKQNLTLLQWQLCRWLNDTRAILCFLSRSVSECSINFMFFPRCRISKSQNTWGPGPLIIIKQFAFRDKSSILYLTPDSCNQLPLVKWFCTTTTFKVIRQHTLINLSCNNPAVVLCISSTHYLHFTVLKYVLHFVYISQYDWSF